MPPISASLLKINSTPMTPPLQVKNQNLLHEEMSMNPSNMKPITAAKAATLILPMDPPHRLRSRQLLACALVEWGMFHYQFLVIKQTRSNQCPRRMVVDLSLRLINSLYEIEANTSEGLETF
mmetsp:Transcript_2790/g.4103  ORF Transcript_2790/g.4103 Transcript_2790/m.4103 type:complete len:122 (-) Transcript_2790:67-432(-)